MNGVRNPYSYSVSADQKFTLHYSKQEFESEKIMKTLLAITVILISLPVQVVAQVEESVPEPPYGMEELEAYSVFADAYRSGDYELAMTYGKWLMEAKPRTLSGYDGFSLERQFRRMIDIYTETAEEENDPSEKNVLLEEAASLFEEFFETFNESEIDEYEWTLRQGRFYQEYHEVLDNAEMADAVESYEKLYEMDPERFAAEGGGYYAQVLLARYESNGERDKALEMIDSIEPLASAELQETIDEVRNSLFENPEQRIEFLESRIAVTDGAGKEEMLGDLIDLYEETGQSGKALESALELYKLRNNFENTKKLATIYLSDGKYRNAIEYLQEALAKAESGSDKKEMTLEIAETYEQLNEMEFARDYARQAIEMDQNWGEAYLEMASIYAGTVSECSNGNNLERKDRTVYWLVLDYLEEAKEKDPSLARDVDSRIEAYEKAMPSSEDKFFSGWEAGDNFEINGELGACYSWINETTVVR